MPARSAFDDAQADLPRTHAGAPHEREAEANAQRVAPAVHPPIIATQIRFEDRSAGPASRHAASPREPEAHSIEITIGRVEVRAGVAGSAEPTRKAPAPGGPTLAEYLRRRSGQGGP